MTDVLHISMSDLLKSPEWEERRVSLSELQKANTQSK